MTFSNLRVFARNCVYMAQDLKDAFWPGQLADALREADFAREALNDFEAAHDGLDGGELPDAPGPRPSYEDAEPRFMVHVDDFGNTVPPHAYTQRFIVGTKDPFASGVASATEAPSSVDASDRPAGDHPPSPAGHSNGDSFSDGVNAAANIVGAEAQQHWRDLLDSPVLVPLVSLQWVCDLLDRLTQELRDHANEYTPK